MSNNTLKARFVVNGKTASEWVSTTTIPLKNEFSYETDTLKCKIGDGVNTYADLTYLWLTPAEVQKLIDTNAYKLPTASASVLGGVKIGTNINIASGVISVNSASTSQKGVVQLSDAVNSTSTSLAATANAVKKAYDQANKMVPLTGGNMTGLLILSGNPTADMGAATKLYVDTQITDKLKTSDAMTYKGTIGSNGTVTAIPTTGIIQGDTYKVITAGSYAGYTCKIGDLLIANASGALEANSTNWSYVPSGDERETTIRYAASGVNITTSAKTGDVILGAASAKQVDTSISTGSTSANLPTSAAVAAFVEEKGYLTTDNKVLNTLSTTTKFYLTGTSSATTNTGTQYFDTGVYVSATAGELYATKFVGALTGNVTGDVSGNSGTATKWKTARTLTIGNTGKSVDGSANVSWSLSEIGAAAASHKHTKADITDFPTSLKNPYALNINGVSYDGSAAKDIDLLPFVVGTQTAATGSWTGTATTISALTDGLTIRYWLPYAGSGNATLNLTLADGKTTGAVNCYYSGTTRLTTHYAAGNVITLTYRSGVSIAGSTTTYTGWWADANYDSGNTKNTAGSTDTSSKIFLIGATSQEANPQTYSHDTAYVGTDGHLYSNNIQVVNLSGTQALTNKTYNGYTLAAACAKAVTDSSSASAIGTGTSLPTERDIYYGLPTINDAHNYTSSTTLFAPITAGTNGQILQSSGSGSPVWIAQSSIAAGKATVLATARNFSISGYATAAAISFNGSANVALNVTNLNAMGLTVGTGDTLIIDGSW